MRSKNVIVSSNLNIWRWGFAVVIAAAALVLLSPIVFAQEPAATSATTWYVDGSTGSDGNCNTAAAPCRTIQAAVSRAASGDTILVAAGTYTFGGGNSCTAETGAPSVVCLFRTKLTLRGGYASGNFSSADPAQNPTIIDGQDQNRGVFVLSYNSPGATALDMSGFTVRNGLGVGIGKRPGEDAYFGFGGGMFVENAGSVVLSNMIFENNRAVGGNQGAGAGGAGSGGAISFRSTQSATLDNVTFTGNQAIGGSGGERGGGALGGAIFTFGSTLTGSNLVFDGNLAQAGNSGGDGITSDGEHADALGGAATFSLNSKITLNGVNAYNNKAIGGNAGVSAGGGFGGALVGEVAEITINGADIRNNLAQGGNGQIGWFGAGGGVMVIHSTLNINRAFIIGNTAQGGNSSNGDWGMPNGGGVMATWVDPNYSAQLNIANSVISGNKAAAGTGKETAIGGGGGLWIQAHNAVLDHTTIADNLLSSPTGGGNFGAGIQILHTGSYGANVTIRKSLLTGHKSNSGSAVDLLTINKVTFDGAIFFGNTYNTSANNAIIGGNAGTISGLGSTSTADPLYVSPGNNYHITAQSPARDKAANVTQSVDVDNEPRNDGSPDYGADEYAPPARPPVAYYGLFSDLTSILLGWDLDPELADQFASYRLTYSYIPPGGGDPIVETIDLGTRTSYHLRNLEPYVIYTFTIDALNSSGDLIASGGAAKQMTTDLKMFLPGVRR